MFKSFLKISAMFIPVKKWRKIVRDFDFEKYKELKEINKTISKYKFIHLMHNDKFGVPLIDFLNKYFDDKENLFIYHSHVYEDKFALPTCENFINIDSIKELKLNQKSANKIIVHGLFSTEVIDWLYKHPKILKKSYWMIWGGDLYCKDKESKKELYVKKNFKGYFCGYDGEFAKKKYGFKGSIHEIHYSFPITIEVINNFRELKQKNDCQIIQINNSCDKSTIEILEILSKFRDENIKIRAILSYGDMIFKDEIIKVGEELFGDKFEPITEYIKPEEYTKILSQNDILILNQQRQQGVGNLTTSLCLGTKVFIRSDVTTYKYLNNNGCKIFDTLQLKELPFNELISYDESIKNQNIKNANKYYDFDYLSSLWVKVLTTK